MAEPLYPTAGIGAGSAFATFELACYVVTEIRNLRLNHPYASLSLHVDDFIPQIIAEKTPNSTLLTSRVVALANDTLERLEGELELPFDPKQVQFATSSKRAATKIARALGNA